MIATLHYFLDAASCIRFQVIALQETTVRRGDERDVRGGAHGIRQERVP